MFENATKISKSMETLVKIAEGLNDDRKQEMTNVIHELAKVHQNVLGDLTKKESEQKIVPIEKE